MLKRGLILVLLLSGLSSSAATLEPVEPDLAPDLFVWTDTGNTFFLREKWGAPIWALENMVDKMEHPEWFDFVVGVRSRD